MITHIEDAYEECPDCGRQVPLRRVDPPAPDYDDTSGRAPLRPSFGPDRCRTCGSEAAPQPRDAAGGDEPP
jgi:hypothetical protein